MATTRANASGPKKITFKTIIDEVVLRSILDTLRIAPPGIIMFYPGTFLDGLALMIIILSFPPEWTDIPLIAVSCVLIYSKIFKLTLLVWFTLTQRERIWDGFVAPMLLKVGAGRLTEDVELQKRVLLVLKGILHLVLLRYGLWWDFWLLWGLNRALSTEYKLPGHVSFWIFLVGALMIRYKIFKKSLGVLCLTLGLVALLCYLWFNHSQSTVSTIRGVTSRPHVKTSIQFWMLIIGVVILYYGFLPDFSLGLRTGRPVWLEFFLSWIVSRAFRKYFPFFLFWLSRLPTQFIIAHLEGLFKYGLFPSVAIVWLWNWLGFGMVSTFRLALLLTIVMQPFAILVERASKKAREMWHCSKHHLILNQLPKDRILEPPDPTHLIARLEAFGASQLPATTLLENLSPFFYRKLAKPQGSFRLFLLDELPLQAPKHAVPSGRLIHASLDNPPPYTSVSYSWGNPNDSQPIIIDEKSFLVTKSLLSALNHIRALRSGVLVLWIDQICIDQKNEVEKGYQVNQMDQIYQKACSNLVWLGEATAQSDRAYDMIKIMTRDTPGDWPVLASRTNAKSHRCKLLDEATFSASDWIAFEITFELRPVWSRVWIIQELVLAKTIELQCGHRVLQWEVIDFFLTASSKFDVGHRLHFRLPGNTILAPNLTPYAVAVIKHNRYVLLRGKQRKTDLTQLLIDFQKWKSTDSRDKIYALLSLAVPDLNTQPDYVQSPKETFRKTTAAILKRDLRIDWVCGDHDRSLQRDDTLPSWVPNFGHLKFLSSYHNPVYDASRSWAGSPFRIGNKALTVLGQHVDHIETLRELALGTEFKSRPPGDASGFEVVGTWERDVWSELWRSIPSQDTCFEELGFLNGAYSDTVWRVLLADCGVDNKRLQEADLKQYREEFKGWYEITGNRVWRRNEPLILRLYQYLRERCLLLFSPKHMLIVDGDVRHRSSPDNSFLRSLKRFSNQERRLAITTGKRLVSVPWNTEVGDEIVVLYQSNTPTLLRKLKETPLLGGLKGLSVVEIVGSVYVHGLMDGQVIQDPERFPRRIYHIR